MPDECELPDFNEYGFLPPGLHAACLGSFRRKFGFNSKRQEMIDYGLKTVCSDLAASRDIHRLYIGGGFVTEKRFPQVIDCYVLAAHLRDPLFWFIGQKSPVWLPSYKVKCELAIQGAKGPGSESYWQDLFGHEDGIPKGIVVLTF